MAFTTKDTFTFDFTAQADYPSWTPLQTKTNLNARGEELRLALNALITALNSVTDGSSGADNLGMTPIPAIDATANNAQAIVEALVTRLQSIVDGSSGGDFVKLTAITGLTGDTIQALLESLKSYVDTQNSSQDNALATHKGSGDHDGRYYTETETNTLLAAKANDNAVVKLTGDQTVTGVKTFSSSPIIPAPTTASQPSTKKYVDDSITGVVLGQIPDNSLTNTKLGTDIKVGSLAALTTTEKGSVVGAVNELKANADAHAANNVQEFQKTRIRMYMGV